MRTMRMVADAAGGCCCLPVLCRRVRRRNWDVTKTVHIGGDGGWDYLTVDPGTHRIFVTRSTHTHGHRRHNRQGAGRYSGAEDGRMARHLCLHAGRGFITDGGGDGAIVVFDLKTYATLGKLATMPDSDGIIYDESQNLVLAVSGDGGKLMTFKPDIDPVNGKIDPPIDLGGAPEFLAADGAGKVYINLEDKDLVAVVDLKTRSVIARWPVAPGGRPVGMAIDREEASAVHRLPQSAEADRDEHGGRQNRGGPAHRRRRGCNQDG